MRPPIRRSKFRYSKCAWQTFIYGGMTTCGRMKVTVKVHRHVAELCENGVAKRHLPCPFSAHHPEDSRDPPSFMVVP